MFVICVFFSINLQILRTSNSFHLQFAKQTSSAAVTSDLFVVWYPGLCSKCLLIHGSSLGNPADPQKAHIQSKPKAVLEKKFSALIDTLPSKKISNKYNKWIAQSCSILLKKSHENKGLVLRREGEKNIKRSNKRVKTKYPLPKRVSAYTREWFVQRLIFGLSLSVNPGASMSVKKR